MTCAVIPRVCFYDKLWPGTSGTKPNLVGENVTGYRYIAHLYCLAVQAGFYSDVVECSLSTRENLVRSPLGKKEFFFAGYISIWWGKMSQGRKKNVARPGLEPRVSRLPCEHSITELPSHSIDRLQWASIIDCFLAF